MFSKKSHLDLKKSQLKVLEAKKDSASRLKHLKIIIECSEPADVKQFFETYYSHVYYIFYDVFLTVENNLKQRVHKALKEELPDVRFVLEKILVFLPELVHKKWQSHSIRNILKKFIHHGNTFKLRKEGIRLFLLWYQILGDNAPDDVDQMYCSLVPGLYPKIPNPYLTTQGSYKGQVAISEQVPESVFYSAVSSPQDELCPVSPTEMAPLIPSQSSEPIPDDVTLEFLECLLSLMVSQVSKIEWQDRKEDMYHNSFNFLFEKFKKYYLPYIFPHFSWYTNIYKPKLVLPELRSEQQMLYELENAGAGQFPHKTTLLKCQTTLVQWLTLFTHIKSIPNNDRNEHPEKLSSSLNSDISEDHSLYNHSIVHQTLYSSRENINLVHEVYRQAFCFSFIHAQMIKCVINVYKDWIHRASTETPIFLQEPENNNESEPEVFKLESGGSLENTEEETRIPQPGTKLRKDSYIRAIFKPMHHLKAGVQKTLQTFIIHAANVFLLELSPNSKETQLEDQVDVSKRVLNIYRYMVMNVAMDTKTWEQLLLTLLQITCQVLKPSPPSRKQDILGGRLAPALFQTLIVTWIRANLNVVISPDLWERFLAVLSSLTQWEELIKEWAKTMDTLTRVLARQVYHLDMSDLPLERLSEQKLKKKRGMKNPTIADSRTIHTGPPSNTLKLDMTDAAPPTALVVNVARVRSGSRETRKGTTLTSYPLNIRSLSDSKLSIKKGISSDPSLVPSQPIGRLDHHDFSGDHSKFYRSSMVRSKSLDFIHHRGDSPCITECSSRSASPTPSTAGLESTSIKDSPMQIDVIVSSTDNSCNTSEIGAPLGEVHSIMAGGIRKGWTPDVSVVLWRRMLGSLGNINNISDPYIHSLVLDYLIELSETLIKIRNNLGVTTDNQSSPPPPELVPPITLITPWLFQAISLPQAFNQGKLRAYKLLVSLTLRKHDLPLPKEFLINFYNIIHEGLMSQDMEVVSTLVTSCGSKYFIYSLPGSTLLILDFICAAHSITSSKLSTVEARIQALYLISSLTAFLNTFDQIQSLKPTTSELVVTPCSNAKDQVISILIKSAKSEPNSRVRCCALNGIGIFVYQDLIHGTNHSKIREAFMVLLSALKFNIKEVAQVASDIFHFLSDESEAIVKFYPDIPVQIIETFIVTLTSFLPSANTNLSDDDKKLLVTLLFCLGEWCMCLPVEYLITYNLLSKVLEILYWGATGHRTHQGNFNSKLSLEDLEPLQDESNNPSRNQDRSASPESFFFRTSLLATDSRSNSAIVQLAAKNLISHLLIHLGHFPMGIGASSLISQINEHDDVPLLGGDDLLPQVFKAPNVQFFVLNNRAIISFVEIAAPENKTEFLTSPSQVRIIIRDLSGKFCWDSSLLYGYANEKKLSVPLDYTSNSDYSSSSTFQKDPSLSAQEVTPEDTLDDLLKYIGQTSPEVVLRPGQPLNAPGPPISDAETENIIISTVLEQCAQEEQYIAQNASYNRATSKPLPEPPPAKQLAPFQFCRLFLDQISLTAWEQRPHFDLLKKNEKLLRELKNLDKQKSREAHKIAIIYVAKGQEDKNSVLLNTGGSQEYEEFIAGLGWEVELESHHGFLGGLANNRTGETTVYYATSLLEVIFHVSTRMPVTSDEDSLTKKLRHLGNDEIHVVWSEHNREYRRGIIATEFCDVLIVIYPLGKQLYRIQISSKPEVPYFGPLYNDAIVDQKALPGLIRSTAINASRVKRHNIPLYQNFFEERTRALDILIENHKDSTSFEQFASNVMTPAPNVISKEFVTHELHRPRPLSMSNSPKFNSKPPFRERPFSTTVAPI